MKNQSVKYNYVNNANGAAFNVIKRENNVKNAEMTCSFGRMYAIEKKLIA